MLHDLQGLAGMIWGRLGDNDAEALNQIALKIGQVEMAARLGALGYRVATGSLDAPNASSWLERQWPRHGRDP